VERASQRSGIVEFRILGPLEVVQSGRTIALGGARQRILLALLLTRANEVLAVDRLIDALWGTNPPRAARNALQYHVSRLRKLLADGETITTREPGYLIRVAPDELDLFRFERLVAEAEDASPDRAVRLLRDALTLWRGPPLLDLADDASAHAEIRRLEELRLAALERRFEADLALGRHGQLIPELEALVREHPFRERLRAALMHALYSTGRQAEALTVYRETRQTLVNELGIVPSPPLQELERAILRQDPALAPARDAAPERAILVVAGDEHHLDALLTVAEPLARKPARELILARLLASHGDIALATAELAERRNILTQRGVECRVAAYTSVDPGADAVRFATDHEVDLVLADASAEFVDSGHPNEQLDAILERAPCDVALLGGRSIAADGPVVTPFGGVEHKLVCDRDRCMGRCLARNDAPPPGNGSRSRSRTPRREPAAGPRLPLGPAGHRHRHRSGPYPRQRARRCGSGARCTAPRARPF